MTQLSKSEFMLFLKHPGWLWIKRYDKDKMPSLENMQAIFEGAFEFEKYAEQLFQNTIKIGFNNYNEYLTLFSRTEAILPKAKVILQGGFRDDEIACIVDVLEKNEDGTYNLYEIKATTKVKEEHYYDLAFQVEVLKRCGIQVKKVSVIFVNNEFVLHDKQIKPENITLIEEITDNVFSKKEIIDENIKGAFQILSLGKNTKPDFSPTKLNILGKLSEWLEVYGNIYQITEDSIYNLPILNSKLAGVLASRGITSQQSIPEDIYESLTARQKVTVDSVKAGKPIINKENIKTFLNDIEYPIHFLDYETYSSVLPAFVKTKPYQQVPVQYSLHILHEDGKLEHKEYLHTSMESPCENIAEHLRQDIYNTGSIIVWNESFEKKCNVLIGEVCNKVQFCEEINKRIVDLIVPFRAADYMDPGFLGSASIKKVLPVLVPELSYEGLDINKGDVAQRKWGEAFVQNKHPQEKDKIAADLLEYCKLDTLAMVEIYKHLKEL